MGHPKFARPKYDPDSIKKNGVVVALCSVVVEW